MEFVQVEPGRFELVVTQSVTALKGLVRKPASPVSIEKMNEAIATQERRHDDRADTNILVRYIAQDDPQFQKRHV